MKPLTIFIAPLHQVEDGRPLPPVPSYRERLAGCYGGLHHPSTSSTYIMKGQVDHIDSLIIDSGQHPLPQPIRIQVGILPMLSFWNESASNLFFPFCCRICSLESRCFWRPWPITIPFLTTALRGYGPGATWMLFFIPSHIGREWSSMWCWRTHSRRHTVDRCNHSDRFIFRTFINFHFSKLYVG